ncbi:hypothetical protein [Sphingomonas sp.]|uniref:hypothetical protein n=1 Tax=Sphingomonas sp. TaxID=28214 RepID=UPI00258483C2|nr:hypothetical protein [Sphingomonas sp.]
MAETDLITRLRDDNTIGCNDDGTIANIQLCGEAADEIERLRMLAARNELASHFRDALDTLADLSSYVGAGIRLHLRQVVDEVRAVLLARIARLDDLVSRVELKAHLLSRRTQIVSRCAAAHHADNLRLLLGRHFRLRLRPLLVTEHGLALRADFLAVELRLLCYERLKLLGRGVSRPLDVYDMAVPQIDGVDHRLRVIGLPNG